MLFDQGALSIRFQKTPWAVVVDHVPGVRRHGKLAMECAPEQPDRAGPLVHFHHYSGENLVHLIPRLLAARRLQVPHCGQFFHGSQPVLAMVDRAQISATQQIGEFAGVNLVALVAKCVAYC